ncbi:MAG: hypothetical protein U0746_05785 [Gemmataceae bacterium]
MLRTFLVARTLVTGAIAAKRPNVFLFAAGLADEREEMHDVASGSRGHVDGMMVLLHARPMAHCSTAMLTVPNPRAATFILPKS